MGMTGMFERVAGPFGVPTGGLVWDGSAILFSVVRNSVVLRYDPADSSVREARRFTNRVNGLALGPTGRLFASQEGSRRIIEFNKDGSASPLVALLDGQRQNYPTDLAVDATGKIWLADPYNPLPSHGPQLFPNLAHASVLLLSRHKVTHDWTMARVTNDTVMPRAVLLSADDTILYVADGEPNTSSPCELRAYAIGDDGSVGAPRLLHSFGNLGAAYRGVEGMCLDRDGNIVACAGSHEAGPGALIYVFSPTGRVLETFAFDEDTPVRCAFGGPDLSELYVTSLNGSLWRAKGTGRAGTVR